MPIVDAVIEVLAYVVGEVIVEGVSSLAKGASPLRLKTAKGAVTLDAHTQQLWIDALVAAAHLDDGEMSEVERTKVRHGLIGFFSTDGQNLIIERAERRATTEDPWRIIEMAILSSEVAAQERLAGYVVAVVLAGTAERTHVEEVLHRLANAGSFDEPTWARIERSARAHLDIAERSRAHRE